MATAIEAWHNVCKLKLQGFFEGTPTTIDSNGDHTQISVVVRSMIPDDEHLKQLLPSNTQFSWRPQSDGPKSWIELKLTCKPLAAPQQQQQRGATSHLVEEEDDRVASDDEHDNDYSDGAQSQGDDNIVKAKSRTSGTAPKNIPSWTRTACQYALGSILVPACAALLAVIAWSTYESNSGPAPSPPPASKPSL